MLSSRVDLTVDRDFSSPDWSEVRSSWNSFAHAYNTSVRLEWDSDVNADRVLLDRLYPWQIYPVESDYLLESPQFDDVLSNELGFQLYGELEDPFVLGNYSDRRIRKLITEEYAGTHCESCGVKLNIFDRVFSKYFSMCKGCSLDYEFQLMKARLFE